MQRLTENPPRQRTAGHHVRDLCPSQTLPRRLAARQRGASQREGTDRRMDGLTDISRLNRPLSSAPHRLSSHPPDAALANAMNARCPVGSLPVEPPDQVDPRPRLRRGVLGAPVQAQGMARICRNGLRCRSGLRGVQLQPEAGIQGDPQAGVTSSSSARPDQPSPPSRP